MQPSTTSGAVAKPNSSAPSSADHHVAAGLHLAVGLHPHAAAQAVEHQGLLGLGQAQLPGRTGMLDRGPGRGARAAVVAGDHHVVGLGLVTPAAMVPTPTSDTSLTLMSRPWVGVLQVVDQLGQVLDGVDVVVGRRRDQAHARHRVAAADVLGHLAARQLAALARLGALGHLDLDLVGIDPGTRWSPRSGPRPPA